MQESFVILLFHRQLSVWCWSCKAVDFDAAGCPLELWKCQNILLQKNTREGIDFFSSFLCWFSSLGLTTSEHFYWQVAKIIIKEFHNNPKVNVWNGEGNQLIHCFEKIFSTLHDKGDYLFFLFFYVNCIDPNPHMGHVALADAFVITADSVSMLSEACSTGYVWCMILRGNL